MDDKDLHTNSKVQFIDQEQLKFLAGAIRKYINDLKILKQNEDIIWENSSSYLDDSALNGINTINGPIIIISAI